MLFYDLLAVIHCQLEQAPADFFDDGMTGENFLVPVLSRLIDNICTVFERVSLGKADDEIGEDWQKLVRRARRFRATLEERFDCSFGVDEADDDEDPVIVDL